MTGTLTGALTILGGGFQRVKKLRDQVGLRTLVWVGVVAATALVLDFVPLFDLLGYDFSFVVGLVLAFAAADVGAGVVTRARAAGEPLGVLAAVLRALGRAAVLVAAPLLLSLLNMVRVRNCNLPAGLAFFALLPLSTALYAGGAGALAGLLVRRRARLLALALPALSLVWTLIGLYRDPPVYALDPFGGYFPGPIYDEALRPPAILVQFRAVNLLWVTAAIAVAHALARVPERGPARLALDPRRWSWRRPTRAALFALLLCAGGVFAFVQRGALGFHRTKADLIQILDGERRSTRVVMRYARAAGASPEDLAFAMEDLEFRYDQLRRTFGVEPRTPITVYVFPNADVKKELVGAGRTLYAKPWTQEIFVQAESFPARRIRHEMAHVFAGAFGDRFFGVSLAWHWKGPIPFPRLASGLVEGVAEAADFTDPTGGSTTHQEAAAMMRQGRAPPLAAVVGPGFSALAGPRAYVVAGSFCRFLLDTRGAAKLRALYASAGEFRDVYGQDLDALGADWKRFLSRVPLSPEQRAEASEQFRRPAIFQKVCAREQAARVNEARSLLPGEPAQAIRLYQRACADDPHEPTLRIELARAQAIAGERQVALGELAAVERDATTTRPLHARAAALAAAIHFQTGDLDNARASLRKVLAATADEGEQRQATAELRALDDESARHTLGRALFGDDLATGLDPVLVFHLLSEFARLHPDEALGPYLVGRQLVGRDPRLALRYLGVACPAPPARPAAAPSAQSPPPRPLQGAPERALPAEFERECLRMTALAAYRAHELARARRAATSLQMESGREADRLRAADFLDRIAWRAAKD